MLITVAVSGYRSLRDVVVPLGRVTVVRGANGTGKSSLYRALRLLAGCARGDVVGSFAQEGGLGSALWAGPATTAGQARGHATEGTVRKGPISVGLGFASRDEVLGDLGYLVDLGLPSQTAQTQSAFLRDPELKREVVFSGPVMRPGSVLVRRRWNVVETFEARHANEVTRSLHPWQSMVSELSDPDRMPELAIVRRQLRSWRFYDAFRADAAAPARMPRVGTRTPVLSDDGSDLAAALQTIREHGFHELDSVIGDAFEGARVQIEVRDGIFDLLMHQPGMLRPLHAAELSDGTLRYLLWVAALLSVDPPPLLVLNEPETSLHPDLLASLARLVQRAAERCQVLVISHSDELVRHLALSPPDDDARADDDEPSSEDAPEGELPDRIHTLSKRFGATVVQGQGMLSRPQWEWGSRR